MIVYDGLKTDFLQNCENDTIAMQIEENVLEKLGKYTPKAEFRSWENSLNYMYKVLNDDEIPNDSGVAIEFNIPQTSKRIDFMISGYDTDEKPGMVIIELKQWDSIKEVIGTDALVETYVGGGNHVLVHPSYQAWSYAQLIQDYNQAVQDNDIVLSPLNQFRIDNPHYQIVNAVFDRIILNFRGDGAEIRGSNANITFHFMQN